MSSRKRSRPIFSVEQELRLAFEVERRPILWDATQEVYKRADLKGRVWADVAASLGPEFTGDDVSSRFKTIKDTFMKNERKVLESRNKCSGAGPEDIYKPKWALYSSLLFLKKNCVQGASTSNIPENILSKFEKVDYPLSSSNQQETSVLQKELETSTTQYYFHENLQQLVLIPSEYENSELSSPVEIPNVVLTGPSSDVLSVPQRPASAPAQSPLSQDEGSQLYAKRGQTKRSNTSLMEEALKAFTDFAKQPTAAPPINPLDREDIFATFVANRLREMEADKKKECENAIMSVLLKY